MCPDFQRKAEIALEKQGESLHRIVSLIDGRIDWQDWLPEDRRVLASALFPESASSFEIMKSENLARHLFRGDVPDIRQMSVVDHVGEADRVRADLAGLVRLGAGRYLSAQIASEAEEPTVVRP